MREGEISFDDVIDRERDANRREMRKDKECEI